MLQASHSDVDNKINTRCFLSQSQGVLSDRLRSFSMQDLSSFQSDSVNTDPGTTQPAAAQHRTRTMMRSKSESYNKGREIISSTKKEEKSHYKH